MTTAADHSTRELARLVADPETFAGGGAVAAASLAGAAATSELVFTLTGRRRKLDADQRQRMSDLAEGARILRGDFLDAMQRDMDVLAALMAALRQRRQKRGTETLEDQGTMATVARDAIDVPIRVAESGLRLLELIDEASPLARTFTLSDLGAAAATARGAIISMLLMARANLDLVPDPEEARRQRGRIAAIESATRDRSEHIIGSVYAAMSGNDGG
jgi:methenyltetrahydrofolate cyclohydrolase